MRLAQSEFLVNGFRNRDLRQALYGEASDPAERRRQSARVRMAAPHDEFRGY